MQRTAEQRKVTINAEVFEASAYLPTMLSSLAKHNPTEALELLQEWGNAARPVLQILEVTRERLADYNTLYILMQLKKIRTVDAAAAERLEQVLSTNELVTFQFVELLQRMERSNVKPTLVLVETMLQLVKDKYTF